jgi:hypothetical protein
MKKNVNIPKIHINPEKLTRSDVDITLMSKHDAFFRRIVEFVLNKVEGTEDGDTLAILVDDNGTEYDMELRPDGYTKSLGKANEFFLSIEEYETCELIKQLKQYLAKDE